MNEMPAPNRDVSVPAPPLAPPPFVPRSDMDLREMLRLLWRQRWLMAGTVAVVVLLSALVLWQTTPRYTATAKIMVDPRQNNVVDLEQVMTGLPVNAETVQGEIEVISSSDLAMRVIEHIGLAQQAEFNPALAPPSWLDRLKAMVGLDAVADTPAAPAQDVANTRLISRFHDALNVKVAGRSRVINISFTSASPTLATDVANATAELYLSGQLQAKFDTTARASKWLSERLGQLRIEAEAAELAVSRFKAENQIGAQAENNKVRLEKQLAEARAALAEAEARLSAIPAGEAGEAERATVLEQQREYQQTVAALAAQQVQAVPLADAGEAQVRLRTLERQAQASRALYETFLARAKETNEQTGLAESGLLQADARLISQAEIPVNPSFPNTRLFMLMALVVGSGLALVLAFMAEQLDSGFRSSDQLESQLGLPTIATLPSLESLGIKNQTPEDYLKAKPASAFAEAIRMLRTSLLLSNVEAPPKVLLVTSATPGEGKTTTILALARLATMAGERVLVLDADIRRPRVHDAIGVENALGLVELLSGQAKFEQVLHSSEPGGKGFHYLTAGCQTPQTTDLIRSQQLKTLIQRLRTVYDLVLIDGPPVLPVADAKMLTSLVDQVVYVVRWNDVRREVVAHAVRQLRDVGTNFAGVVLNNVNVRRNAEYGYGDSGYYYGRQSKYYTD